MDECEDCGKLVERAPTDDAMDCFCHRCPRCNELIYDGLAIGDLCLDCDPYDEGEHDDQYQAGL